MLGLALMAAAAAGGPGKCVKDEDTKRFPETQQTAYLLSDKSVTRPGDTIELAARWRDGPFGVKEIPLACLKKWQVDPKQAVLSSDRRTLRFADDVPAGSSVSVSAMFGKSVIRGSFKITGREERVLYGTWSEASSTGCGRNARRVAELTFGYNGGYSFTFPDMMVETMTSGGGNYTWDAVAGTLKLGANTGKATLSSDTLTLEGLKFDWVAPELLGIDPKTGTAILAPEGVCRIVFRKSGG